MEAIHIKHDTDILSGGRLDCSFFLELKEVHICICIYTHYMVVRNPFARDGQRLAPGKQEEKNKGHTQLGFQNKEFMSVFWMANFGFLCS